MKVLLVGEFSGVHTNLAKGLRDRGHNVLVMSNGDGYRNFPRDIDISGYFSNIQLRSKFRIIQQLFAVNLLPSDFDVIQLMNPSVFSGYHFQKYCLSILRKKTKKLFLLGAGDDYFYWKAYRDHKFKYSTHKKSLDLDIKANESPWESEELKKLNNFVVKLVDGIIPCATEYRIGYIGNPKLKRLIPFPIQIESCVSATLEFEQNTKLRILHGIQKGREGFKGSDLIDKAMSIILLQYPNDIEYIRPVSIPFNEYSQLLKSIHIVIDQTNSYSPAMNALNAMSYGKIVLGGAEQEYLDDMKLESVPIINIKPDVNDIVEKIKSIVNTKMNLIQFSIESRKFVEKNYDYKKVSQEFIKVWQS